MAAREGQAPGSAGGSGMTPFVPDRPPRAVLQECIRWSGDYVEDTTQWPWRPAGPARPQGRVTCSHTEQYAVWPRILRAWGKKTANPGKTGKPERSTSSTRPTRTIFWSGTIRLRRRRKRRRHKTDLIRPPPRWTRLGPGVTGPDFGSPLRARTWPCVCRRTPASCGRVPNLSAGPPRHPSANAQGPF
jgi:hypothetical protein